MIPLQGCMLIVLGSQMCDDDLFIVYCIKPQPEQEIIIIIIYTRILQLE